MWRTLQATQKEGSFQTPSIPGDETQCEYGVFHNTEGEDLVNMKPSKIQSLPKLDKKDNWSIPRFQYFYFTTH